MRTYAVLVLIILSLISMHVWAQKPDSVSQERKKFKWIAPAALIVSGTALMLDTDADEFFISSKVCQLFRTRATGNGC
jgi:hypothetical protein